MFLSVAYRELVDIYNIKEVPLKTVQEIELEYWQSVQAESEQGLN